MFVQDWRQLIQPSKVLLEVDMYVTCLRLVTNVLMTCHYLVGYMEGATEDQIQELEKTCSIEELGQAEQRWNW